MCRASVTTFARCKHSMMMYEFCEDCPIPNNPLKTRKSAKQIMWSKEPDPIKWMRTDSRFSRSVLWLSGTEKGLEKMAACRQWPKDLKEYEKKSVDRRCPTGKGACTGASTLAIEEFDVNGKELERPSGWTVAWRGCVGSIHNWLPET